MKKTLILALFLLSFSPIFSQQAEKKTIIAEGKGDNKNIIQAGGLSTNQSGSMGYLTYDYLPLKNGGFLRRNDFTFQVFDKDQKLVWEKPLKSEFGLSKYPEEYTTSNEEFIYFLEIEHKGKMRLTRFKISNGEVKSAEGSFDKKLDKVVGIFAGSKGFHYLVSKLDHKDDRLDYFMGTFAGEALNHSIKSVELAADKGGKYIPLLMEFDERMVGVWKANDSFSSKSGGIQLTKSFAFKHKGVNYVTSETLFLNENGQVENHIKTEFPSAVEEYLVVQALYNEKKSEFFTLAFKEDQALEMIITNNSGETVSTNEYLLSELQSLIPFKNKFGGEIEKMNKVVANIFYDQVNDSYLLVNQANDPTEGFIFHLTSDLKVARIDYADWIYTLGLPSDFTVGGTGSTQRLHQLEWDRYYGSGSVLILNLKNPKRAYIDKSANYNHTLYDAILKNQEGKDFKDYEYIILNTNNNSKVVVIENAAKRSVETLTVK